MNTICEDCGICCLNTEMTLSEKDIKRITENYQGDLKREDFSLMTDQGFYILKNVDHHCFFFNYSKKTCEIYSFKPKGCEIYPLTYDLSAKSCVFDEECPKPQFFYNKKKKIKIGCNKLRKFLVEELKITNITEID